MPIAARLPAGEVRLRHVSEDDLPIFFEHQQDPEANRMAGFPPRERDAFMTHWHTILRDVTVVVRTILLDGQVAGNVVAFDFEGRREVGYWIGRAFWGKGVATRALRAFLDEVTERPLYAGVAEHNVASIRVLEKCGFALSRLSHGAEPSTDDASELLFELGNELDDPPSGSPAHPIGCGAVASVNVRYMVGDVDEAVAFYTTYLGFTLISSAAPAFADVARGDLRLLLSGATSSAGRPMPDGRTPEPGGWTRILLVVDDLASEVARLRGAGLRFRNEIVKGPGGSQILLDDPSGNPIELFQPR